MNFSMRGDVIVLEGVPRRIVLRSGRDLALIEHVAASAAPPPAGPTTTPPTVSPTPLAARAPDHREAP